MASDASTPPAPGTPYFSPDFLLQLGSYQRAIRGQRIAGWARDRGLEDDLVQLALLDLARVEGRYDPARATSAHHFRMAVLPSRVNDCVDALMRMHPDFVSLDEERSESAFPDENVEHEEVDEDAFQLGDSVLDLVIRRQFAMALRTAISALPVVQRRVLELVLEDYTDREIAEELGVSIQAVCTARGKGIAKVRVALAEHLLN